MPGMDDPVVPNAITNAQYLLDLRFLSLLVASFMYLIGVDALGKSGFTNRVLSQFAFAGFFFLLFFIMRGNFRS